MKTVFQNQTVSYTDVSGNSATIHPGVGFTISTPTNQLTANSTGFNNGTNPILLKDLYDGIQKTKCLYKNTSIYNPDRVLTIVDTVIVADVYPNQTSNVIIESTCVRVEGTTLDIGARVGINNILIYDNVNNFSSISRATSLSLANLNTGNNSYITYDTLNFTDPINGSSFITATQLQMSSPYEYYLTSSVDYNGFTATGLVNNENSRLTKDSLTITGANVNTGPPLVSTLVPASLTLTNGVTTNTLDYQNWSGNIRTENTISPSTYYLIFSDSSLSTYGKPQKTASISCIPSIGLITATTFAGNHQTTTTPSEITSFIAGVLSLNASSLSYINFNWVVNGTTNSMTGINITSQRTNGNYYVGILNKGTGDLTINTGLTGTNIKTKYSSNVIVPTNGLAVININILSISGVVYMVVDAYKIA